MSAQIALRPEEISAQAGLRAAVDMPSFTSSINRDGSVLGSVFLGSGSTEMRAANHIGSVVDDWPMYSSQPEDYALGDIIGLGASSVVYQAKFLPFNGRACAVKVIDMEAFGRDTEELRRETQLMSLSKHPSVLRVRGCWVSGTKLHIATRLMSSGSLLDIMRYAYRDGFPEDVICTVLKQSLQGLNYLHINNWLHRDLKAANLLVDDDGTVLLGDFGVGVWVDDGNQTGAGGKRKSFVGTPCWMAPEVVERKHYNAKADIWSFGITALELSQGHAPYSRLAPVKVLLKTLQEDPPTLDRNGRAHKYSKAFDDFVRLCLQKDSAKRPSADKLLKHPFFKSAKSPRYLATTILAQLPPLSQRQERKRATSVASLRNQQSWDFGASPPSSIRPSGSTPRTPVSPSGSGYIFSQRDGSHAHDPFASFTANIASPGHSPWNSLRGRQAAVLTPSFMSSFAGGNIISIDGEHAIAVEEADEEGDGADNTTERCTTDSKTAPNQTSGDVVKLSTPTPQQRSGLSTSLGMPETSRPRSAGAEEDADASRSPRRSDYSEYSADQKLPSLEGTAPEKDQAKQEDRSEPLRTPSAGLERLNIA